MLTRGPSVEEGRGRRHALALLLLCAGGCGADDPQGPRPVEADGSTEPDGGPDEPVPLVARLTAPAHALVGEPVPLDATGSDGALRFGWVVGDGPMQDPTEEPTTTLVFDEPGRYRVVLTVFGQDGLTASSSAVIAVTPPLAFTPAQTGTIAILPGRGAAVVSPDSNEVVILRADAEHGFDVDRRVATAAGPRTIALWEDRLAVACQDAGVVDLLPVDDGGTATEVELPYGSRPYGVLPVGGSLLVSLQGTGQVAEIVPDAALGAALVRRLDVVRDARGLALLPDGRLAVTRWRSSNEGGEVAVVALDTEDVAIWRLPLDPRAPVDATNYGVNYPDRDIRIGGVPSYLGQVLVSPWGHEAAVPGLQANVGQGSFRTGTPLTHETTVRSVVSYLDLDLESERPLPRRQINDRGLASAGAHSAWGDYLYLAMRDNGAVVRLDRLGGIVGQSGPRDAAESTALQVGSGLEGLALSEDGRFLLVDADLSREVVVFAIEDFDGPSPVPRVRLPKVVREPLSPLVLRGKRLFNDADDLRISRYGYVTCAHCHLEGEGDFFVWDFTDRGEGLRNTISLAGRGGGDGPLHWSANYDEVQDFERDIRTAFGGTGLMDDTIYQEREPPLGPAKAGLAEDLDALAAYVQTLTRDRPSPWRAADGSLTADAERGRVSFESTSTGCTDCHAGERLTDSQLLSPLEPVLHDVGTLSPGSGQRAGEELEGLDTPSLHGLWASAPYLHDGSAPSLRDVLTTRNTEDRHGTTSGLTSAEIDDLVAYLLSLDGRRD